MSATGHAITVIRLVRVGGAQGAATPRGVVAELREGELHIDADAHRTYLIVSRDRSLGEGSERRSVSDIRVGDVVGWVAESYGALWVADQVDG